MSHDFDLFVIGAGSGGVRAARFAAGFGAKVAVAESRYLGGTCVNVGCVPKKLLVYGAHFADDFQQAESFGWTAGKANFDWPSLIANKNREIDRLNGIYRKLLINSGVTLLEGHARLADANHVDVNGQRFSAERILIATGGWPQIPKIPGHEYAITSNEAFFLEELPKRILVVGGGYIAVEFAGIFNGLGADTRLLYRGDLFLRGFDQSVRIHLAEELTKRGLRLDFNTDIVQIEKQADGSLLATLKDGTQLETDSIFYATGRRPMLDNLGLENTRVEFNEAGYIDVNEHFETREPSILALGDVIGGVQLTPVATAEGMAVARRLFKPEQYRPVDYRHIPTAVFSQPNIGTVGLTEQQAIEQGHKVVVFENRFRPMKLTLTQSPEQTLMKLVVDAESDRVLGCHMVGPDAGDIIQGLAIALKAGATKRLFDDTIGVHPTSAEEFVTLREAVSSR
ncbi:glutathione-disulfide reductase [Pseudomonas sp. B14-6]|uniref:glutathione-disulfide reductase n=1 Tax=unclassified Pseudomonas TaxID=196821 RepID=UPI000D6D3067|nr:MULTISPECIES: glutathione-disulfide reductase [unclassified Pseudomonas]AWM91369.1 glutathione-disulfide reductase [Pseudomonas sp. 31-12]QKG68501.1 glutathione-disulfide reductase [Pseudomonas sp. B14-6]